jgi:hypothetical protein
MNTAQVINLLFVLADSCDAAVREMPSTVCDEQRLTLTGLARAFQLTGDRLKREAAERERKLIGEPA